MIESRYLGLEGFGNEKMNVADILYESDNLELIKKIIVQVCHEVSKIINVYHENLSEDDMIIGLDTGPYNFIYNSDGKVYYVDFYPPRNRFRHQNEKIPDQLVITDYPKPRDEFQKRHLFKYFYTKKGVWVHTLSHLFACLDSNSYFMEKVLNERPSIRREIEIEIWNALDANEFFFVKTDEFYKLRDKFYNHREKYYNNSRVNGNKGFNISGKSIVQKNGVEFIQKFYLNGEKGFSKGEGDVMIENCQYFYAQLSLYGMYLPETSFHLIERQGIIIAAGIGRRLGDLTDKFPKMLVSICKKPMAKYISDHLINCGVSSITSVIPEIYRSVIEEFFQSSYQNIDAKLLSASRKGFGFALDSCYELFYKSNSQLLITPCDIICLNGYNQLYEGLNHFDLVLGINSNKIIASKKYTYGRMENGNLILSNNDRLGGKPLNGIFAVRSSSGFFSRLREKVRAVEDRRMSNEMAIQQGILNDKNEYRVSWIFRELSIAKFKIALIDCGVCFEINSKKEIIDAEEFINS